MLSKLNTFKYLGVILDSRLRWKAHVDTKCQNAILVFNQIRRTTGKTWGFSPKIVHWLYTMVIRPMITYAAVVWWPRVNYTTVEKQLEHVQRLACLYITGAMHTTPTIALQMIIGLTPLDVYIKQEAMLSCFRLQVNSQWVQVPVVIQPLKILCSMQFQYLTNSAIELHHDICLTETMSWKYLTALIG